MGRTIHLRIDYQPWCNQAVSTYPRLESNAALVGWVMTSEEQLSLWCSGSSLHNDEKDECCPDFSCCNKDADTPIEVRERFRKAFKEKDDKTIQGMLGMFLGTAIAAYTDKKVHIAGEDTGSLQ